MIIQTDSCLYDALVTDLLQHATAEMQRLSNPEMDVEPPKTDAAWAPWEAERAAKQSAEDAASNEQARKDWLRFQSMIASGYDKNLLAVDYIQACEHLGLPSDDPHWMIPQPDGTSQKCGLYPWQVIGADWLQRSKRVGNIHPLLADDCGLGKTVQGLAAMYADYVDAKAGRLQGPFKPSMILAPRILAPNWIADNKKLMGNALNMYLWQGRSVDSGQGLVAKDHILDLTDQQLKDWLEKQDSTDPETMRICIVSSYGTGWKRSLYQDGMMTKHIPKAEDRLADEDDSADEEAADGAGAAADDEKDQQSSVTYDTTLTGMSCAPQCPCPIWMIIQMQ